MNKFRLEIAEAKGTRTYLKKEVLNYYEGLRILTDISYEDIEDCHVGTELWWVIIEHKEGEPWNEVGNMNGHFTQCLEPIISNVNIK